MNYNHHSESLPQVYIDQFIKDGVVVIPSVISKQLVDETIVEMNQYLHKSCGFDSTNMLSTAKTLSTLSSTNGSGGILDVYYQHWKLRINEDATVVSILQSLWKHTYAKVNHNDDHHDGVDNGGNDISVDVDVDSSGSDLHHIFSHPYGAFNPSHGYMYIDRICYRLPTIISNSYGKSKRSHLQRSLTPHLDCCPHNMYRPGSKWRPIQAFIALTDSLSSEQGGFEACFGLHKQFEQWTHRRGMYVISMETNMPSTSMETTDSGDSSSSNSCNSSSSSSSSSNECESNTKSDHNSMNKSNTRSYKSNTASNKSNHLDLLPPCVGDFTPIRPVEDRDILDRFQHVPCKAGDLVCWVSSYLPIIIASTMLY